jgi:hypothetical protein
MLKIDKKERERILRLHESKNSKNLLSEQGSADTFIDNQAQQNLQNADNTTTSTSSAPRLSYLEVQKQLNDAYSGWGTNVKLAKDAFSRILSSQFDQVIDYLRREDVTIGEYSGLLAALQGEYGVGNYNDLVDLNRIFRENNSKYMLTWKTTGARGKKVEDINFTDNPEYDASKSKNTTEDGQQNTGGTTTNTGGSSSGILTKQIQKTLGIPETGKMDQETINKAYDAVSKR